MDQQSTLASSSFDSTEPSDASYDGSLPLTVVPESTSRRRDHPDASSADAPLNVTNFHDPHDSRPVKRLHSASGSLRGSLLDVSVPSASLKGQAECLVTDPTAAVLVASTTEEQLSVVQRNFQDAVVQKVRPPELTGMSRRQREKALSEYRNELKVCQLVFMGFDEDAVRRALKETHRKDIRTEQHVQDAAHLLNMDQLVNLVRRALNEPPREDSATERAQESQ